MKKAFVLLLALSLVVTVVGSTGFAASSEKLYITMGGGPANGATYNFMTATASLMSRKYDRYFFTPEITNGSVENVNMIKNGIATLGSCQSDAMYFAHIGEREFDESTRGKINFVMMGLEMFVAMLVPVDSDIQSFADVAGKRGGVVSGTMLQAYYPILLESYEVDPKSVTARSLTITDVCTGIADRTLDFGLIPGTLATATVAELARTFDIRFVPITGEVAGEIVEKYPYFSKTILKGDVYDTGADTETISVRTGVVCSPDADEQFIYEMLDTVLSNPEEYAALGAATGSFNKDNALKFSDLIPMHPGAERYYKEHGMM